MQILAAILLIFHTYVNFENIINMPPLWGSGAYSMCPYICAQDAFVKPEENRHIELIYVIKIACLRALFPASSLIHRPSSIIS